MSADADLVALVVGRLEDVMGLPAGRLSPDIALSSLPQWDSLAALQMLMQLEALVEAPLDPATLFQCETPARMADLVADVREGARA